MTICKPSWSSYWVALVGGLVAWFFSRSIPLAVAVWAGFLSIIWVPIYREYAKDNPHGYWFKRKMYGWGWTPVKWQGWLTIAIFTAGIGFIVAYSSALVNPSKVEVFYRIIAPVVILLAVLIKICYVKGESPSWHWGRK